MKLNKEYKEITNDIVNNINFLTLKEDIHHGSNRYDHCKRVSYLSFLMAKIFKGNAKEVAISGLLHDFFHGSSKEDDRISYINHPKVSINNASKYFNLTENEKKDIETHMYHYALVKNTFPFINKKEKVNAKDFKPTSKEGYIVCLCDLLVSIYEVGYYKVKYTTCLYIIFLINTLIIK